MTGPAHAAFRFALSPTTSIYYAQATPGDPPNPRLAFLPPDGAPLPPTLTLAESWAMEAGVYLFIGAAAASAPAFAAGVRAVVSSQPWTGTRLLWITDPNAQVNDWQLAGIPLVGLTADGGRLATLTVFSFRNYGCLLNGGLELTAGAPGLSSASPRPATGDIRLTAAQRRDRAAGHRGPGDDPADRAGGGMPDVRRPAAGRRLCATVPSAPSTPWTWAAGSSSTTRTWQAPGCSPRAAIRSSTPPRPRPPRTPPPPSNSPRSSTRSRRLTATGPA